MSPPFLRDGGTGYWGYPTSTMDWCEENYSTTYYIAEFYLPLTTSNSQTFLLYLIFPLYQELHGNSVSNILFVVLPLTVLYYTKSKLELRYHLDLGFLAVIGFGSYAFHSTLLYHSQLLDELPMIYGTCTMLYCIVECKSKENQLNYFTASIFTFVSLVVTWIYVYSKNPLIFLTCYGILAAMLLFLHIFKCIKHNGSKRLLFWGSFSYLIGFVCWNIDNEMCSSVRSAREQLPGLLRPVTQLHAWWHIFAGIGTFLSIMFSINLRIRCLGYEPSMKLVRGILPYYVKGYALDPTITASKKLDLNGNYDSSNQMNHKNNGNLGYFSRLL